MKGKRYPRIVQLQRVELSERVAIEFLPSGSWKFEEARGDAAAVEGISMVFGQDEVAALIRLVRGLEGEEREEEREPSPSEIPHEIVQTWWDESEDGGSWRIHCSCGWTYVTAGNVSEATEAHTAHANHAARVRAAAAAEAGRC